MGVRDPELIAYQGRPGAYSHLAAGELFARAPTLPCATFEEALRSVREGRASCAVIPVENSLAGRVADVHRLLPDTGLQIVGEHYLRIHHELLAVPGAAIEEVSEIRSHVHALSQCQRVIAELGALPVVSADTAGAAEEVARLGDPRVAAIASRLAGELHGLITLRSHVEDAPHNTTRFLVMAPESSQVAPAPGVVVTTFVFEVRSVPAALYKALGGFATNGVNMTKLESYLKDGAFTAARFYADIEGHPSDPAVARALDELRYFSHELRILGVYRRGKLPAQ